MGESRNSVGARLRMTKAIPKKIAAIDFGTKRIGLAISNDSKTMALPWTTIPGGLPSAVAALQKRKEEIGSIVIGLPLLMNGTKGEMAALVEAFGKQLETSLNIPVVLFDERLSSKHAESALRETGQSRKKNSEKTDQIAASLLLQSYLETLPTQRNTGDSL